MNFFKKFLTLCLFVSILSSCQQEDVIPVVEDSVTMTDVESMHQAYITKHGQDATIEYTSLEEMNEVFVANGFEAVTLEELGITQEEYDFGQERINSGNVADLRCDEPVYQFLGDMNDNGTLSAADIVLARKVLVGTLPPSQNSVYFGYLSAVWQSNFSQGTLDLTTFDLIVARLVILATPCP